MPIGSFDLCLGDHVVRVLGEPKRAHGAATHASACSSRGGRSIGEQQEGHPVCPELWPGNTTDVTTLIPIVDRLKRTFQVGEVCVVADRGMISAKTMDELEARGWSSILGVRMRSSNEAQAIADRDEGHYRTVFPSRRTAKDPAPLRVKQIWREDRRYLVCLHADEATKDRHDREAIVAALEKALAQGDKSLVGTKGFRRFLKTQGTRFAIDEAKVAAHARYDGKWVLRTNTNLAMEVVAPGLQTPVDGRSDVPLDEDGAGNAAHLSQAG